MMYYGIAVVSYMYCTWYVRHAEYDHCCYYFFIIISVIISIIICTNLIRYGHCDALGPIANIFGLSNRWKMHI